VSDVCLESKSHLKRAHAAQSQSAGFAQEETLGISHNHTYNAGISDGTFRGTVKRPLCNTGIIIILKDVRSIRNALTGQAAAALHMASCSYTS
jgi:hypothetical protein